MTGRATGGESVAVVVTGSAGFIGRALVADLAARGEQVVGIDRAGPPGPTGAVWLTADLLDRDEMVDTALRTADAVFHLAGCPGVRGNGPALARARHRDNVLATERVLRAVPPDVPLVVASSSSVYGGTQGRASRETDPVRPQGDYARSKVEAERLCARRLVAGGVVSMARPFTVAGVGQRPDMALARWLRDALAGRPLRVLGSLERTRDVTDVRDAVHVFVELARRQVRGPVNVGSGVGHTLGQMVAAVVEAVGREVDTYVEPAEPAEVQATLADTRRLGELVGFVPRTDLRSLVAHQASAVASAVVT